MALINSTYDPPQLTNLRAVEAGDAAEMVSRLNNEVQAAIAAGEEEMCDFKLAGCGSGPQWQGWIIEGESLVVVALTDVKFVAAVAGNPTEALFYLKQRLAAVIGTGAAAIFKIEVAGAGDGRSYMAVAVFSTSV